MNASPDESGKRADARRRARARTSDVVIALAIVAVVAITLYFAFGMPGMPGMDHGTPLSTMGHDGSAALSLVGAARFEGRMLEPDAFVVNVHTPTVCWARCESARPWSSAWSSHSA